MSAPELTSQPPHVTQFSVLYVDHHGWLQSWLCKKLGCVHRAADMTQDTFVQVLASRRAHEIVEPRAYLTTLAQRVLFNFWRRRDLERAYLQTLPERAQQIAPSLEDQQILLEALDQIDAVLQGLPKATRAVFVLNQLHELGYREIGERLNMSFITVRRHMQRAIRACYLALAYE